MVENDKEAVNKILYRHRAWLTSLRFALRQQKPWEIPEITDEKRKELFNRLTYNPERVETLEDSLKPLLSEEEYQKVMGSPNKASAVLALQSKHLSALKNDKKVWEFSYLQIEDLIKEFYTLQGKSERIKNFPYPRQYFTLGVHLTWAFILLLPYAMIPEFTRIGEVISKTTAISPDLFTFYFFLYSICGLCIMDISHNGANGTCW